MRTGDFFKCHPIRPRWVTPLSMRRQIRALDFVFAFFALCGALKSNCPAYRPARGQVMLVIECTGIAAQRAD